MRSISVGGKIKDSNGLNPDSSRRECDVLPMNTGFKWAIVLHSSLFAPILHSSLADALGRKRQRDGFGGLALLPQCGREPCPPCSKHRIATGFCQRSRPKISGCSSRILSLCPSDCANG